MNTAQIFNSLFTICSSLWVKYTLPYLIIDYNQTPYIYELKCAGRIHSVSLHHVCTSILQTLITVNSELYTVSLLHVSRFSKQGYVSSTLIANSSTPTNLSNSLQPHRDQSENKPFHLIRNSREICQMLSNQQIPYKKDNWF